MARQSNRLTAKRIEGRATARPGYYADGAGLYLQVSPSGGKSWIFRYMLNGRAREMGLGSVGLIGLAEARLNRDACRKLLGEGKDPIEARRSDEMRKALDAARSMTFAQCAEAYIESHRAGWRNEKHIWQWSHTLETQCGPVFGAIPVQEVDTALVLKVLQPIWRSKTETATRLRGRIERVLDWAKVREYRTGDNPARWRGHLDSLLPALEKRRRVKHHPALAFAEVGSFIQTLRAQPGIAARALEFTILTATRTGEAINARWREFDLDAALWTVPGQRMKAHREHRVPLSPRAVAILRELEKVSTGEFVFPGARKGKPLSNMSMVVLMRRMHEESAASGGRGWTDPRDDRIAVPHGFRSSFRDWTAERTSYPRDVCEMALSHVVSNQVEAAYRRGDLFEKRRRLMNEWAKHCSHAHAQPAGQVLPVQSA